MPCLPLRVAFIWSLPTWVNWRGRNSSKQFSSRRAGWTCWYVWMSFQFSGSWWWSPPNSWWYRGDSPPRTTPTAGRWNTRWQPETKSIIFVTFWKVRGRILQRICTTLMKCSWILYKIWSGATEKRKWRRENGDNSKNDIKDLWSVRGLCCLQSFTGQVMPGHKVNSSHAFVSFAYPTFW